MGGEENSAAAKPNYNLERDENAENPLWVQFEKQFSTLQGAGRSGTEREKRARKMGKG